MKNITLPVKLRNLPQPWAETDFARRDKVVEILSYKPHEIKSALNVLERCLHTLSQLPPFSDSGDLVPESLMEYWGFTAQWLAQDIPTLDQLRLSKIEGKLKEYGIDSPSPELILDLAEHWLSWTTWSIFKAALRWVEDAFSKNRDLILISRFLLIVERNWQKLSPDLAQSLLSSSAIIGWQKALPLFERVQQNPQAEEEVKETARDYHRFVLKYPENWLPEVEDKEELAQSKRVVTTQPAFGQLAWGAMPTS